MKTEDQREVAAGYRRLLAALGRRPTSVEDLEAAGIRVRNVPKTTPKPARRRTASKPATSRKKVK